jgi:choline-glycine betaine transporter
VNVFRQGLPLTIKSCFYPLIGDKIFGWPGDLVDTLSGTYKRRVFR